MRIFEKLCIGLFAIKHRLALIANLTPPAHEVFSYAAEHGVPKVFGPRMLTQS